MLGSSWHHVVAKYNYKEWRLYADTMLDDVKDSNEGISIYNWYEVR